MESYFKDSNDKWHYPLVRVLPFFFLRKNSTANLVKGGDYSLLAALLILVIYIFRDRLTVEPKLVFSVWGFTKFFVQLFATSVFCYLASKSEERDIPTSILFSLLLEVGVWVLLCDTVVGANLFVAHKKYDYWQYAAAFFSVWELVAIAGILLVTFSYSVISAKGYFLSFIVIALVPFIFLNLGRTSFWYHDYSDAKNNNKLSDYEDIFYSQDRLLNEALYQVAPGVPGQIDLFYLGVASYSSQDVFKKEVEYIFNLFKGKFYDSNRGMLLVNHEDTIKRYPMAIGRNIDLALQGIAKKMNVDEDILFIYLTSHGSRNHELAVSFYPFQFVDITPEKLKHYLDDSGIKWKVIVISACYSGGFLDTFKDENTLIATAADSNNTSFGCSNENDFTYYGEALFHDHLAKNIPIMDSFADSIKTIEERETQEKLKHSNPQLWIGKDIREHIQQFESGLKIKQASN